MAFFSHCIYSSCSYNFDFVLYAKNRVLSNTSFPIFLSLVFLTGFEKVPILGMNAVKMTVRPPFSFTQDRLPEALTCHALLDLPVYQKKKTLKAKLIEAINHKRGFWEEWGRCWRTLTKIKSVILIFLGITRDCFLIYKGDRGLS